MVPSGRLVAPTAIGIIALPKPESVTVEVFEKLTKPPPGSMSGFRVKADVTEVLLGSTCLAVLVVATGPVTVPKLIDEPPEVNAETVPLTVPLAFMLVTLIEPEAEP
jgi:hypothetical protein